MLLRCVVLFASAVLLLAVPAATAQAPPPVPKLVPQFNPSSPLIIPQAPEVPVSPGFGNGIGGSRPAIGGLPDSSYSIMVRETPDKIAVKHRHKRHIAVHPAH